MDYTVSSIGRDFGSVFLGDKNVAMLVVSQGWAKVCFFYFLSYALLISCVIFSFIQVYAVSCAGPGAT